MTDAFYCYGCDRRRPLHLRVEPRNGKARCTVCTARVKRTKNAKQVVVYRSRTGPITLEPQMRARRNFSQRQWAKGYLPPFCKT